MKKLLVFLGLVIGLSCVAQAEELRPQFRLWKTSTIAGVNNTDTFFASAPVIFHSIQIGSPTINNSGGSYFALYVSTTRTLQPNRVDFSTKTFLSLDSSILAGTVSHTWDIATSSPSAPFSFYSKQGGSRITILWDWLNYSWPSAYSEHRND